MLSEAFCPIAEAKCPAPNWQMEAAGGLHSGVNPSCKLHRAKIPCLLFRTLETFATE
jgi:hypothetical protein